MSNTIYASQRFVETAHGVEFAVDFGLADAAQQTVWWRVRSPSEVLPTEPQDADLALTSLLFLAMGRRTDLHIRGGVSRSLLDRAERFMQIWSLWQPDAYGTVHLSADQELPDRAPDEARDRMAVCAFSGGVDAACTALMHRRGLAGRATRQLLTGVLIQGFDVGLEDRLAFEITERSSGAMLDDLGVPLSILQTNWKSEVCGNWELEHGAGVSSCLKLWENRVGSLHYGSCEDYSRLVVPWGSHPMPTTMLAARGIDLVYDGGHLNRTQKVGILSDWPEGYNQLRVCWEGEITGKNCGACEKCIRTKLNALVIGKPLPASLPGRPTTRQVSRIGPMNGVQKGLFQEILDEAKKAGYNDPLLAAVKVALARTRPPIDVRLKRRLKSLPRDLRQKLRKR